MFKPTQKKVDQLDKNFQQEQEVRTKMENAKIEIEQVLKKYDLILFPVIQLVERQKEPSKDGSVKL